MLETRAGFRTDGSDPGTDYSISQDACWLLRPKAPNVTALTLSFARFDVEQGFDYIKVYDGRNVRAPQLYDGPRSGTDLPPTVSSTGPELLLTFHSDLSITENGISCTLSKYLPQYIAKNMAGFVDSFLSKHSLKKTDLDFWAVHPGGRRIIEESQNGLGLTDEQAKYSWAVLGEYGNMLSPSVMFVMEKIMKDHEKARAAGEKGFSKGIAFSFSPGVGAEGILINVN